MEARSRDEAISLVVATVDRTEPLVRLFDSLGRQNRPPDEVIVVDQNRRALPETILRREQYPFCLVHLHLPGQHGVSWARNRGLRQASGHWIGFPDDDCWYPKDYLEKALGVARRFGADVVTGRPADLAGRTINGRFGARPCRITRRNVFVSQIEWNMLASRSALMAIGGYDESISLGGPTPWQGGEGFDLLLRALEAGYCCRYDPALVAHHEEHPVRHPDAAMIVKGRRYGRGLGRVLAKHRMGFVTAAWWIARSLANLGLAALALHGGRVRYFAGQAAGRFEGWSGLTFGPIDRVRIVPQGGATILQSDLPG